MDAADVDIDQAGLELIAGFEGFVAHPYRDVVGVLTIGYGHVILPGESFPAPISKQDGLDLLHLDAAKAVHCVRDHVQVDLNQNQTNALVSLTFNIGAGAFASSTLLRLLNQGNYECAARQFPAWCIAGGKQNFVLLKRRQKEAAVFLAPPPPPTNPEPVA